jgi:hypothetical protein
MAEIISNKGTNGEPLTDAQGNPIQGAEIIAVHHGGANVSDGDVFRVTTDSNGEYAFTDADLPATYSKGSTATTEYVDLYARIGSSNDIRRATPIHPWQGYQLEATLPASVSYQWAASDLNLNDGDTVSTWTASKGGVDLQAVGSPVYRASEINGESAVEYNGIDEGHQNDENNASFSFSQPNYTVAVCKMLNSQGNRVVTGNFDDTNDVRQILTLNNGDPGISVYAGSFLGDGRADTNWHILGGYFDGASSEFRLDGSLNTSGDAGSNDQTGITLGANQAVSGNYLDGQIAEVLIAESPSDSDITDIESYLSTKYGI